MNLFDKLVLEAIKNNTEVSSLRVVVEKELLHHEILRTLKNHHLLTKLTFMGGTALRMCYGGVRLSEDLDFTGGNDFTKDCLSTLGQVLIKTLQDKYSLEVKVTEPNKDKLNVDTWKIAIETRPKQKHLPAQRINIDVCSVNSYEKVPMMLLNPYGVEMGTSGLVIQTQSREEIYTDKLLAFAFRPNRIKYRDLWDISWLHGQGIKPRLELIAKKLRDRNLNIELFLKSFDERIIILKENDKVVIGFKHEIQRFLPISIIKQTLEQDDLFQFIVYLMEDLVKQIRISL